MRYTLTLGRNQLAIRFGRKRGRPKKTFTDYLKDYFSRLARIATDKRFAGHPISRVLRVVFENKKIKKILGFNLAAIVLFVGVIVPPLSAFTENTQVEITSLTPGVIKLTTEASVRLPVDSLNVTQGYYLFHRAIDLKETAGAPVYPIMAGRVEGVFFSRFSYGNHIIINHGSGFKSLYAHLAKIVVEKDEEVDKNTVIGTVGSTGWATGSHLHLEVYDNNRPFNPLVILK